MKNQYFGDNKDLFTYDLIWQVMQAGLVEYFIFIPMLTKPDGTGHGRKMNRSKATGGTQNEELMAFLDECVKNGRRNIKQLENFFAENSIRMTIYHGEDTYFSHQKRREYFGQIRDELLTKSLVFVDPDIGLEVARSREQHVLYKEVKDLYQRMDNGSILMVYQCFPRKPHMEYLNIRMEELKEKVSGDYPLCIDDDEIIFFFLTKDESLEHSLTHVIQDYAGRYSKYNDFEKGLVEIGD